VLSNDITPNSTSTHFPFRFLLTVQSCRHGSLKRAVFVVVSSANGAGNCLL